MWDFLFHAVIQCYRYGSGIDQKIMPLYHFKSTNKFLYCSAKCTNQGCGIAMPGSSDVYKESVKHGNFSVWDKLKKLHNNFQT